jgi:hypothetical protein
MNTEWTPLPHGPIEKLEENLWTVTGGLGIGLQRVMVIARRDDGRLVLHGLMALDEPAQKQVEALGEIAFLLVPSGYHRMDGPRYRARYPHAKMLCPAGARARVEKKVKVDGTFEDYPADASTELVEVAGLAKREGALVVRSKAGVTLVLNDALFNMPHAPGFRGFVFRHVTKSSAGPRVTRLARLGIIADKAAYRAQLETFAEMPGLVRVLVAHHLPITDDVAGTLRAVATTL